MPVTYRVEVRNFQDLKRTKFFVGGTEVTKFNALRGPSSPEFYFEAVGYRGDEHYGPGLPKISVRTQFPCGWREMLLNPVFPTYTAVMDAVQKKTEPVIELRPDRQERGGFRSFWELIVDNRIGDAAVLSLGEMELQVEAREITYLGIDQPDCSQGRSVKLNGETIGTLPVIGQKESAGYALIDPTAKRCYRLRDVTYSTFTFSPKPENIVVLSRAKMHVLPRKPNFVLGGSPEKVTVQVPLDKSFDPQTVKTELAEVACR